MGCGNNKVSRDYLTSQPVSTPSAKAARASAASVGSQVLRVISQVSQQSADRAARAQAQVARDTKAAEAKARVEAERKAAEKKTADKKAKAEEERVLEEAQRLLASAAYHAAQPALEEYQLLPGQPETVEIMYKGQPKTVRSYATHVGDRFVEQLVDADGEHTQSPLHIHTKVRDDGTVFMQGTDRRDGKEDHFGKIEVLVPDAPDELLDALLDVVADMIRERE